MKSFTPKLFLPLFALSSMVYAASDNKNLDINVTHIEFLRFIGSAADATRYLSPDQIRGASNNGPHPTISLGTLGLESSISGICTLVFESVHDFELKPSQGNAIFAKYKLDYKGNTIQLSNPTMTLPCSSPPSSIDFTAVGKMKNKAKAGGYSDIVTITVTSP